MRFFTVCVLFLIVQNIFAQNQAPVVSNVDFYERTDGSFFVDVYYDLYDAENDTMQVSISVSSNEGLTWDFPADSVWGDVGEGVTSATGKHIIWNFGAEHKQFYSDSIQIKIIANDAVVDSLVDSLSCQDTPVVSYGGKIYRTVQIGTQCWLRENLDIGIMIASNSYGDNQTNNGIIEKYCMENIPANCTTYGGLYQWGEAMQYVTTEETQGICPVGWHIPSEAAFSYLYATAGYSAYALENQQRGTNTSGFSALFAGYRTSLYGNDGSFGGFTTEISFWSSTENISGGAAYIYFFYAWDYVNFYYSGLTNGGFSIRCLKD